MYDAYVSDDCGRTWILQGLAEEMASNSLYPSSGRPIAATDSVAVGGDDALFVAGSLQIWTGRNGGATWRQENTGRPSYSVVTTVEGPRAVYLLSPASNDSVEVLWRSSDEGLTWVARRLAYRASQVVVDPWKPDSVFIVVSPDDILRVVASTGASEPVPTPTATTWDSWRGRNVRLTADLQRKRLWAATSLPEYRLWTSEDQGQTWRHVPTPVGPRSTRSIAVSPFDAERLFVVDAENNLWTIRISGGEEMQPLPGQERVPVQLPKE